MKADKNFDDECRAATAVSKALARLRQNYGSDAVRAVIRQEAAAARRTPDRPRRYGQKLSPWAKRVRKSLWGKGRGR